jgi:chromosome segregation ATPase
MADDTGGDGLRERLTRQGEDALGRLAQDLFENPLIHGAIARAFEAREKAAQAQEVAFGALNIPSAADIDRLTRRVRSLSQRLEGIEDSIDRLEERLAMVAASAGHDDRLSRIEGRLDEISRDVNGLRESVSPSGDPVPRAQERLTVTDS